MIKTLVKAFACLLVVLAGVAVSLPSRAQDNYCVGISELAENVMTARQKDVPMSASMAIADLHPNLRELITIMVQHAYERSSYSSERYQQKAISRFRDMWAASCYKARSQL